MVLVFKVVVLGLAVAALVLNALSLAPVEVYVALLALGLFTISVVLLTEKKKKD